jgi:hypothetical protein
MTPEAVHQVSSEGSYVCGLSAVRGGVNTYSENQEKDLKFLLNQLKSGIRTFRNVMKKHEKTWKAWVNLSHA